MTSPVPANQSVLAKLLLSLLVMEMFGCAPPPTAEFIPLTVFVVRHAEKVDDSRDAGLSEAGQQRAQLLGRMLRDADIQCVHSTDLLRTRGTVTPLTEELGLQLELYDGGIQTALVEQLLTTGGRHLVVGHSNTVPKLVELLTGQSTAPFDENEYDRMLIVTKVGPTADVHLIRYGP